MLSPVPIDYDPSNGSWNVFALQLLLNDGGYELLPLAFQSLGHAMSFGKPQINGDWKQDAPGKPWYGRLASHSPYYDKAREVFIEQFVMVLDGHPVSNRG